MGEYYNKPSILRNTMVTHVCNETGGRATPLFHERQVYWVLAYGKYASCVYCVDVSSPVIFFVKMKRGFQPFQNICSAILLGITKHIIIVSPGIFFGKPKGLI